MFEPTPVLMQQEFQVAKENTEAYLAAFEDQKRRRAGSHFRGSNEDSGEPFRANIYHRWLSYVKPQVAWNNPRAKVGTVQMRDQSTDAKMVELALNQLIVSNKLGRFLAKGPIDDMQYNYGAVYVSPEPVPQARPIEGVGHDYSPGDPRFRYEEASVPWYPKCYRVPQVRFVEDPYAMWGDEVRWRGHIFARDRKSVIEEGKRNGSWDLDQIGDRGDADLDLLGRKRTDSKRDEIVGVTFWVPEYELEADNEWGVPASPGREYGFNGTIFTMMVDQAVAYDEKKIDEPGKWLRPPRPFYGPPWGPHILFGVYDVPDDPRPLGPLTAVEEEIRQLNKDVGVHTNMMRRYKRLLLLRNARAQDIQFIKSGRHDHVYRVNVGRDDIMAAEIGGGTPQGQAHVEFSQRNLEDGLGLAELHSGNVPGKGTATENLLANSAGQVRFSGVQQAVDWGTQDLLTTLAWYLYEDNRVAVPLPPEAARALREMGLDMPDRPMTNDSGEIVLGRDGEPMMVPPQPMYLGGRRGRKTSFNSLFVTIEPFSMSKNTEEMQQRRVMEAFNIVLQAVPIVAQYPDLPWAELMEKIGNAFNMPLLGDFFSSPEKFMQAGMAAGMTPGQMGQAMPRLVQSGASARPLSGGVGSPVRPSMPGNERGAMLAAGSREAS